MRNALLVDRWIASVFCLVTMMLSACATVEPPQIQLDRSVYFVAPDGTGIEIERGAYRVEQAAESQIRLIPAGNALPIVLGAEPMQSGLDLKIPTAMALRFEPDAYDLIFLRAGGSGLRTHGWVSEDQSRDLSVIALGELLVGPDLVGSIHKIVGTCWHVGPWSTGCLDHWTAVVKNQGNRDAGPSTVRISSCSPSIPGSRFPVGPLMPGQTVYISLAGHTTVKDVSVPFTNTDCPKPWSWVVDAQNAVAESNEANNISGPYK